MSKLSRRQFISSTAAVGIAGAVATPASANVTCPPNTKAVLEKDYPAGVDSHALFQPDPMPTPDLELSKTFNLGRSTLDEGEVINAGRWGVVHAHVQGGKLTSVRPFEFDYAPSVNLAGLGETPYLPARIRFPMVRESYLREGPKSREKRGEDKWVRVSWDTALDLVAKEIDRVYDNYGPSAVWGRSYGWMSTGKINASIPNLQRLLNLRGGYVPTTNSYSTAAISKILPYVVGTGDPRATSWDNILEHSERVVFWGCDPIVTNDIDWFTTIHNCAGYIRALKENKKIRTVAVNPLKPDTAEYLDSEWIAPRPGTDCAFMLGMIHELVRSGKADKDFLERCTAGHKEFLDYVAGKTDGVEKTPAWAEKVCGVKKEKIVEFAHDLADHRTMIMMGWGIQRIDFGEQSHWMGFALASVLGQIGLPGGGIGTNYAYSNGGCPSCNGPFLPGLPGSPKPVKSFNKNWKGKGTMPVARFVDAFLNPGKTIDFNGGKVTYPDIRLVFWAGGNPYAHQPETNRLRRAWKKPETVIVSDIFWTATAREADIVLPACTTFETNDITNIGSYTNDGIVAMQQAIEPQFESKPNFWIFSELAKRLGMEEAFTEGLTMNQWIERVYEQSRRMGAKMGVEMPEFKEFWKKGYFMFDVKPKDRDYVAYADYRKDPAAHPLSTESGRIQLFSPKIASYGYDDCLGHPSYIQPTEGVNNRTAETPLAFMACKSRYRLHSQLDGSSSRNFANIEGREPCWINPVDAKARGIVDGDVVLVENKRGKVLAGVWVTDRVMPGVICIHHGAWYDPQKVGGETIDVRGNSNTLTMDKPTSRLACGNIASTALVQVRKYRGELPQIKVYDAPYARLDRRA